MNHLNKKQLEDYCYELKFIISELLAEISQITNSAYCQEYADEELLLKSKQIIEKHENH